MNFLNRLFPEEKDFYKMLHDQSLKTKEGLEYLEKYMNTGNKEYALKVREIEKEADELRRILICELDKTFITPFDRADIFALSRAIDDILDYSKTTIDEMEIYELEPTEELRQMVVILVEASRAINSAIENLKNDRNSANESAIKAKKLENKVERLYRDYLAKLVKKEDISYVLKMREIYRHLSNLADKSDLAADIIGHIIVTLN
ncbi:MAG: putative phosphate transport regulator [Defluviitaleaceae bacterium]|nr:putative phosphate transport regulator [Defluviitaleaceae bacterium]